MNSINWPALNVWVFIAHCSTVALTQRPRVRILLKPEKLIRDCLNRDHNCYDHIVIHLYLPSSHNTDMAPVCYLRIGSCVFWGFGIFGLGLGLLFFTSLSCGVTKTLLTHFFQEKGPFFSCLEVTIHLACQ